MHEQAIAQDIINTAKKYGNVSSIVVEVGDLGHLPLEDLKATMEKMVEWKIGAIGGGRESFH